MTEVIEEVDQPTAPWASGKSSPFEGEEVGSIPTGASKLAYRLEPVPGKEFAYRVLDKITGEPVDITAKLQQAMDEGKIG